MQLDIDAKQTTTNIPKCVTKEELQQTLSQDEYLQQLKEHVIKGWSDNKDEIPQDMRTYWTFSDSIEVIHGVILKGRQVVMPETLQRQALEQLHANHMAIQKTKLLTCQPIYWTDMSNDMENNI